MKKITLFAFLTIAAISVNAQLGGLVDKASKTAAAAGFDVNKLTSSIMGKLIPGLGLNSGQQPKVNDAVAGFLTQKSDIMPLQTSNPTEYKKKQGGLFSGLQSKLGGILAKDQMNKFLGMKPATNNPADALSHLFY
ncbi:MAG: hypothetical protein RLZZ28_2448 [Bacteroidota bacterium]|jgi:hypothetical protein